MIELASLACSGGGLRHLPGYSTPFRLNGAFAVGTPGPDGVLWAREPLGAHYEGVVVAAWCSACEELLAARASDPASPAATKNLFFLDTEAMSDVESAMDRGELSPEASLAASEAVARSGQLVTNPKRLQGLGARAVRLEEVPASWFPFSENGAAERVEPPHRPRTGLLDNTLAAGVPPGAQPCYPRSMNWTPLFPLAELPPGAMKARGGVLVVHSTDGRVFAMENACPHQGYPLSQGTISGCIVTCPWHNFKFDAQTGACVMGEESARTHEVRVQDGVIEVRRDLSIDTAAVWASLTEGMRRVQMSRVARDVCRLLTAGVPATELLAWGAAWDADRCEYGLGHATALASDLVGWLDQPPAGVSLDEHQVQVVTEALDLAARSVVGMEKRRRPEPTPVLDVATALAGLRDRVEAEDAGGAEAWMRGMVAAGWTRTQLEAALYPLVADHFIDFGHELIYVGKTLDLLDAAGPSQADSLLGGLVFGITNGTREDVLPPWRAFRSRWDTFAAEGGPGRAFAARVDGPRDREAEAALVRAMGDGTPSVCFGAVAETLTSGRWDTVVNALVLGGVERMLRFDLRHDADPTVEEGWLDVTHRFTSANAVHLAVARWDHPDAARLLLLVAHFVNLARTLDGPVETPSAPLRSFAELQAYVLEDHTARAIFFAHDVKTLVAAAAESIRLDDPAPLRATARFLENELSERPIRRFAHQAVRLVRDGKPPHGLTG